jgi:hypothetical protein
VKIEACHTEREKTRKGSSILGKKQTGKRKKRLSRKREFLPRDTRNRGKVCEAEGVAKSED